MNSDSIDLELSDFDDDLEEKIKNRQLRRDAGEPRGRKSRNSSREQIRRLRKAHIRD